MLSGEQREIAHELNAPFKASEIEWRVQQCGETKNGVWCMVLCYVQNRAIMNRLDQVFGPLFWKNEYKEWHGMGQLCGISVYSSDLGEWITKWDGADNTDVDATKGGLSNAMKRTAVQFGIGRYLYKLPTSFANVSDSKQKGWMKGRTKSQKNFWWEIPTLPAWALPKEEKK